MEKDTILQKDQKFFSVDELKGKGFSSYKIRKLVDEGKLIKLNKKYYENQSRISRRRIRFLLY